MAKLVYGMNVSLDGYVDHEAFAPGPELFRHWITYVRSVSGSVYGSRTYALMRYWEEDDASWGPDEHAFAEAWRAQPKWVVSRTLREVGPNATLISDDLEQLSDLKARLDGEIDVGGTVLAAGLAALGLIDEYRLYVHPVVLGGGTPYFRGFRPSLSLLSSEPMGEGVVRLCYAADSATVSAQ
ncbi:MAG: dihydrofolate reductase family protein [Alphaproteobacteria bacterium]|nr:dihydrofolate reductase family protein [Alphaproteobacteria bacterium]